MSALNHFVPGVCVGEFFLMWGTVKSNMINNIQNTSAVYHKSHKFFKNLGANWSLRQKNGDMNQVPYWWPTDIWCNCTKFSCPGDAVPWICESTV